MEQEQVISQLTALVQGEISPANWLAWWDQNLSSLERKLPRTAFLKIKPNKAFGVTRAALISQTGAADFLGKEGIALVRSDVYSRDWAHEVVDLEKSYDSKNKAVRGEFQKNFLAVQTSFPRLYKALVKHLSFDDTVTSGISLSDISLKEHTLDYTFSENQKMFFTLFSVIQLDGIKIEFSRVNWIEVNNQKLLFIGEYWSKNDGDSVVCKPESADAVYYFNHSSNSDSLNLLSETFLDFIEKKLAKFIKANGEE